LTLTLVSITVGHESLSESSTVYGVVFYDTPHCRTRRKSFCHRVLRRIGRPWSLYLTSDHRCRCRVLVITRKERQVIDIAVVRPERRTFQIGVTPASWHVCIGLGLE